jgi:hypothetical protein
MSSFFAVYPVLTNPSGGGGSGVSSVNGETGAIEILAGTGISVTTVGNDITIANTGAGSGTVTSVGLADDTGLFNVTGSPVTTSGTLTLASLASQPANEVLASPNGSSGAPTFRALVAADIPALPYSPTLTFNAPLSDTSNVVSFHELLPAISQTIFVSLAGNDSTGNGSPTSPYLTIGKAFSTITTSGISNPFVVEVGAGVFTETSLTFPVWTFLKGSGVQATSIIDTSGTVNMASAAFSSGSQRSGMQDIRIRQTALKADYQAAGGSGSDQLYLNNVQVDQAVTLRGRGSDASTIIDCKIFGAFSSSAMQDLVIGTVFDGSVTENDAGSPGTATYAPNFVGCALFSSLNVTAAGPSTVAATVAGGPVSGPITITGSTASLAADSTSIGSSLPTLVSGGTLSYISNALGNGYSPSTPANWPVVPAQVAQALDELAARTSSPGLSDYVYTLTPTDITNKYITLPSAPLTANLTLMTVIGGPMQSYGPDYAVSGSQLGWSGLFLDGVLVSGDILVVEFN